MGRSIVPAILGNLTCGLSLRRGQKPTRESNCPVDALRTRRLEAPGLDDLQDLLIDAATDELHRTHGHCGALWRNQHVNDSRTLPSVTGHQTTVLRDRAADTPPSSTT